MLFRSALLEVHPFRTGLAVGLVGLMVTLGSGHGGAVGELLGGGSRLLGGTGSVLVGLTALLAGGLLLSGASYGALLRRSGHAVRRAHGAARRRGAGREKAADQAMSPARRRAPRARAAGRRRPRLPRRRLRGSLRAAAAAGRRRADRGAGAALRGAPRPEGEYVLPDRSVLKTSPAASGNAKADRPAHGRHARAGARALRRRGDDRRPDRGPARHALRAPARPRDEGVEGRGAQGRPLLRARDDRDPDPRPDPGQAGGRRRGAEPRAADRHARRHLRRPALEREPARRLARQGHLGQRRLGRPGADAAHPDRRHDRLGQVGLHQHDPDLDPAPLDPGRGADDPDRPEADRAQLLRVDPAPAHPGRLEPEGGERRPHERRRRDGAPLRAASRSSAPATCPRRTAPSARAARTRSRTCSSSSTSSPT